MALAVSNLENISMGFGIKKLMPCLVGWVRLEEVSGSCAQSRTIFRVGPCSSGGVSCPWWAVEQHTAALLIPLTPAAAGEQE